MAESRNPAIDAGHSENTPRERRWRDTTTGPMARRTLALVLLMTLVAGGCTTGPREWIRNGLKVGPNYAKPPAPVSDQWIDADNPNLIPQATDYSYWWRVFNDPVLDELVEAAYQENLPLKIAGMRVLEARAQLGVATGNLLPQQQRMTGGYQRSEMSENAYPFGDFACRGGASTRGRSDSTPPGNLTSGEGFAGWSNRPTPT